MAQLLNGEVKEFEFSHSKVSSTRILCFQAFIWDTEGNGSNCVSESVASTLENEKDHELVTTETGLFLSREAFIKGKWGHKNGTYHVAC